jgi:hypothetical protein
MLSCGESKNDDVIDMGDVTPHAKERIKDSLSEILPDTLRGYLDTALLSELKLTVNGICQVEIDLLPQRLSPKSSFGYKMGFKKDSLTYIHWSYKDSVYTKNALYNWLDCFGTKCKSVRLGEAVSMQRKGMLLFMSDTSITYISSNQPLKKEDWLPYFESYANRKDWRLVIEQKNSGKATWFAVKELEFSPIQLK